MRCAAELLAYAAILLGYFLAFESVTPSEPVVTINLDKKVYAFPKYCIDAWMKNVSEPGCFEELFYFRAHATKYSIKCAKMTVGCDVFTRVAHLETCNMSWPISPTDNASIDFTMQQRGVFSSCASRAPGTFSVWLEVRFLHKQGSSLHDGPLSRSNTLTVKYQIDNAPTVRFEVLKYTSYQVSSYQIVNGTDDLTMSSTVTLGSKSFDSKVVVNIIVEDEDMFEENADPFEYCTISEASVFLKPYWTLNNSFGIPNYRDISEKNEGQQLIWWQNATLIKNGTHVQVQYTFYVYAMSTRVNVMLNKEIGLRKRLDTPVDANILLWFSVTSGWKNAVKDVYLDLHVTMKHDLLKATSNCTDVFCRRRNAVTTTNGSCSSSSSCLVSLQLDKRVYAFKPECVSDWKNNLTSPNCNFSLGFKVIRERNRNPFGWTADELIESLSVGYSGRNYSLALDRDRKRELFEQTYNESANADYVDFQLGVGEIFKTVKQDMVGKVSFWLRAKFRDNRFTTYKQVDQYSEARVQFEIDKAPTVRFQVLNDASSQSQVGSTMMHTMSGVNGAWSSTVNLGLKSLGSKVVVNVTVNDADVFEENADRFECSAIGEVSVTLSAVVRLSSSTLSTSEATTPDGMPSELVLALNTGESTQALTWWQNATLEKNEALLKVQYSFDVSALSLAVNARLKRVNEINASNWDTQVTLTLSASATSGRTHSQKGAASLNLVLTLQRGLLSDTSTASSAHEKSLQVLAVSSASVNVCGQLTLVVVAMVLIRQYFC